MFLFSCFGELLLPSPTAREQERETGGQKGRSWSVSGRTAGTTE
jgi:hypothetical protein